MRQVLFSKATQPLLWMKAVFVYRNVCVHDNWSCMDTHYCRIHLAVHAAVRVSLVATATLSWSTGNNAGSTQEGVIYNLCVIDVTPLVCEAAGGEHRVCHQHSA
jgi:hypothetical protein